MLGKKIFRNSIHAATIFMMLAAAPFFAQASVSRNPMMGGGIMGPPVNQRPPSLQFVGIEQHLDAEVPADLTFTDESGKTVQLGEYFGQGEF